MAANMVPFAPQQYFADRLPAAGGRLWVYEKGTTTPATGSIWYDLDGLIAGSNPIQLDSAGRPQPSGMWYLSAGAYTLYLHDAAGAQIGDPVDIQVGYSMWGGNETINEGTAIIVKTYADVRGLVGQWDVVYACGRSAEGDGGQGWFQYISGETGVDDDGICLVAGSRHYVRVYDSQIDPLWYGLVYTTSTDQTANVLKVLTASDRWNRPVALSGSVYITQSVTVSSGQSLVANVGGKFYSSDDTPVTITFQSGSRLQCFGETFGVGVSPKFQEDVVPRVYASWMGGLDDAIVAKMVGCASGTTALTVVLDATLSVGLDFTFPTNIALDVEGGRFNVTAQIDVSIPTLAYNGYAPWLVYGLAASVGSIDFGGRECYLEWFGAVADGTTDVSIPWTAGVHHGRIILLGKYLVTSSLTVASQLTLIGSLASAPGFVITTLANMPEPTVILSGAGTRLTLPANSVLACSNVGIAFDQTTGKIDGNLSSAIILLDNCVVFSLSTTAVLNATRMSASSCSMNARTMIGPSGSNLFYSNCTFGLGGVGYTTHERIQQVLELDYLVPPTNGPNPPLVCRPSDKTVQLGNASIASLLSGGFSFGPGTVVTSTYQYIGPTDPIVTYVTSTSNVVIDLPTAAEMAAEPTASLIRIIVLCRRGVGSDNQVWIGNASQSCWYGQATSDPDSTRAVRIPAPTTYRMGMILYFINGYWAQLG